MEEKKSLFTRVSSKVYCWALPRGALTRRDYCSAVTTLADGAKNQRFLNREEWHAEMVAGLMISHSTENDELLIYSCSLEPKYYSKILRGLKCRTRILLENVGHAGALDVIRGLPQDVRGRIDLRVAHASRGKHFMVVRNSFRCDVDEPGNELSVVCNFNESDAAQRLRDRFETMWEKSSSGIYFF